jgi:hypothetical protein
MEVGEGSSASKNAVPLGLHPIQGQEKVGRVLPATTHLSSSGLYATALTWACPDRSLETRVQLSPSGLKAATALLTPALLLPPKTKPGVTCPRQQEAQTTNNRRAKPPDMKRGPVLATPADIQPCPFGRIDVTAWQQPLNLSSLCCRLGLVGSGGARPISSSRSPSPLLNTLPGAALSLKNSPPKRAHLRAPLPPHTSHAPHLTTHPAR